MGKQERGRAKSKKGKQVTAANHGSMVAGAGGQFEIDV